MRRSGVAARRRELERALDELEAGAVLVVTKLDRLARSTLDLLRIVDQITFRGLQDAKIKPLVEPFNAECWRSMCRPATGCSRPRQGQ